MRGLRSAPPPGTRVKLTGYFLRSTGQFRGPAGTEKWSTVTCSCGMCARGTHVAIDVPLYTATGYEDQTQEWRNNAKEHVALANLEIVGAKHRAADQSDMCVIYGGNAKTKKRAA